MIIEARVPIDRALGETWSETLAAHGDARWSVFENIQSGGAELHGYFVSRDEAAWEWERLRAAAPADLAAAADPVFAELPDADWRESYKAHFHAWRCGRLHWVPEWERGKHRLPRGHVAVWLDPGLAFGTGNHETTRLCVERLVALARARRPAARARLRVIDAGCGSGILAISAAKLGFGHVLAFDNDPEAAAVARENARRNRVASKLRIEAGDLADILAGRRADLVLANIQADVLVRHAAVLIGAVAPGGRLVLSGILARERGEVRRTFLKQAPGRVADSRVLGEWADVVLAPARRGRGIAAEAHR